MKLNLPSALISKITTMADSTVRIVLDCQEMSAERMAELFTLKQGGELLEISTESIEEPKSKSQRLRAVIYKLWQQNCTEIAKTEVLEFEPYYAQEMEKIINHYKAKL